MLSGRPNGNARPDFMSRVKTAGCATKPKFWGLCRIWCFALVRHTIRFKKFLRVAVTEQISGTLLAQGWRKHVYGRNKLCMRRNLVRVCVLSQEAAQDMRASESIRYRSFWSLV